MSVSRKVQMGVSSGGDPFSFAEASYEVGSGKNNHLGPQELRTAGTNTANTAAVGIDFNSDGTVAIVLAYNDINDRVSIASYDLSKAYDLSTAVIVATNTLLGGFTGRPQSFRLSPDGTKLYYRRTNDDLLYQQEFGTAYDVTTIQGTTYSSYDLGGGFGLVFNDDGTTAWYVNTDATPSLVPISFTTAYDFSGGYTLGTPFNFTNNDFLSITGSRVYTLDFSHDGTVLYTGTVTSVAAVEVSTAYDLSTIDDTNQSRRDTNGYRPRVPSGGGRIISDSSSVRLFGTWESSTYSVQYGFTGLGVTCSVAGEGPDASTNPNAFMWEFKSSVFAPDYSSSNALNTTVYNNISGGQTIQDYWFDAGGTTLYVSRSKDTNEPNYVTENTLSSAFDIGSLSTLGTSVSDTTTTDVTKAFVMDDGNKLAYFKAGASGIFTITYELSTPYDISTNGTTIGSLNLLSDSFRNVYRLLANTSGVTFNDDGTKIYFSYGTTTNTLDTRTIAVPMPSQVAEFPLSTAWDPTTIDLSGLPWIVHDQGTNNSTQTTSTGFEFKSDGTEFYGVGTERNEFYTLTPLTAFGVDAPSRSGATQSSFLTVQAGTRSSSLESFQFKSDGTRCYLFDDLPGRQIVQRDLTTAWDAHGTLSTLTNYTDYPDNAVRRIDNETDTFNITFNPTGTKYYRLSPNYITEYTLSTAWDLSTTSASPTATLSVLNNPFGWGDIVWGNSGFKLYRLGRYNSTVGWPFIEEFTATTAYDLSSVNTTATNTVALEILAGSTVTFPAGLRFNPSGTRLIISATNFNANTEFVAQYTLSTAWNLSTINGTTPHQPTDITTMSIVNDRYYNIEFNPTGDRMYLNGGDWMYEFTLGTAFDISSTILQLYQIPTTDWPGSAGQTGGFYMTADGTKLFRGSTYGTYGRTQRFDFGTARTWSSISAGPSSNSFSPFYVDTFTTTNNRRAVGLEVTDVRLSSDGTKLYAYERFTKSYDNPDGNQNGGFSRYDLSTAWDVSTASYHSFKAISPTQTSAVIKGFDISSNGSYIIYGDGGDLYIAEMTTPYDLSTLGTFTSFSSVNNGTNARSKGYIALVDPIAVRFNSDGTAIYTRGYYTTDEAAYVKIPLTTAYSLANVADSKFPAGIGDGGPLDNIGVTATYGSYLFSPVFADNGNKFYVGYARDLSYPIRSEEEPRTMLAYNEYTLSTAYDLSTATFENTLDLTDPTKHFGQGALRGGGMDIYWKDDGRKFYIAQGLLIGTYKV